MKKIAILIVIAISFSLIFPVYANAVSVVASYDASSGTVTLSTSASGATTIVVRKDGVLLSSLSDGNLPVDADQIIVNGTYTHDFYLPEGTPYGKYIITVSDAYGSAEDSIIYYNKSVADAILRDNISTDNFVNDVKSSAEALGIDTSLPSYSDDTLTLMSKIYTSYEDSADFNNKYNYCVAVCSFKNKDMQGIEETLKKYESILQIDYESDYEKNTKLSSDDKTRLCSLLSKMDYSSVYKEAISITGESKPFAAVLKSNSALAVIKGGESWEALRRIYTEDFNFLKKNVVDVNASYKNLSSTDVFTELKKLSFDNVKDIKSNFNTACINATPKQGLTPAPDNSNPGSVTTRVPSAPAGGYDEVPTQSGTGMAAPSPAIAIVPSLEAASGAAFTDVSNDDWFAGAVLTLGASGVLNGDANGSFRPYDNITRAEFAKIITAAFSLTGGTPTEFADVPKDAWYYSYVQRAASAGIINGYNGIFSPDDNISKQDAAVMLYRVSKLLKAEYTGIKKPVDYADASTYAWTAIGSFCESGIIKGDLNGNFNPLSSITRAEASQLVCAFINDLNTKLN